jgi:hypothetical protein
VWNVNGLTILRGCNFSKPLIIIISLNNNNNNSYWSKNPNKGLSSIQNMTNTTKSTLSSCNDLDICKMCILGVNKLHSLNQSKKQD